jgi:hypothetical protein
MNGVEPMRQARQAPKTCAGAAVPESPLGALEFAERLKMNTRGDFGGNQRLVETDIMPGERAWWLEWASLE